MAIPFFSKAFPGTGAAGDHSHDALDWNSHAIDETAGVTTPTDQGADPDSDQDTEQAADQASEHAADPDTQPDTSPDVADPAAAHNEAPIDLITGLPNPGLAGHLPDGLPDEAQDTEAADHHHQFDWAF